MNCTRAMQKPWLYCQDEQRKAMPWYLTNLIIQFSKHLHLHPATCLITAELKRFITQTSNKIYLFLNKKPPGCRPSYSIVKFTPSLIGTNQLWFISTSFAKLGYQMFEVTSCWAECTNSTETQFTQTKTPKVAGREISAISICTIYINLNLLL